MSILEELQDNYGMETDEAVDASRDEFDDPVSCRLGWIGVGQGGTNLAIMARLLGYTAVLAINTSKSDVDESILHPKTIHKLFIGPAGTDGTAKHRELARKYAFDSTLEIRNAIEMAFQDDVEKIVVCLTMGGGTGSGAGPHVIEMAKEYIVKRGGNPKCDVVVLAAYPAPALDGARYCANALEADKEIDALGVAIAPIDNAKLLESNKGASLTEMWRDPNYWVVETFHRFNVYSKMESNLGRFDKEEWNDILSRGRFFYTMFRVPALDNKFAITNRMGDHLKRTMFADMEPDKAEISGCVLAVNSDTLANVPYEFVTSAFASINTILKGAGTLHKGIYSETFKKGKKAKNASAAYGYVVFGGMPPSRNMLENLFANTGNYFEGYSSYEAWRNS